jgi:hypothetical protein
LRAEGGISSSYSMAIIAVGAAVIVLFAGASVTVALKHPVPEALWATAGALTGALVGILVPPPGKTADKAGAAGTGAGVIHAAAISAAEGRANQIETERGPTAPETAVARASVDEVQAAGNRIFREVSLASAPIHSTGVDLGDLVAGIAVSAHRSGFEEAQRRAAQVGARPAAKVAEQVHGDAYAAASKARVEAVKQANASLLATTNRSLDWFKVLVPLLVFAVAATFGVLILAGAFHPTGCRLTGTNGTGCDAGLVGTGNALIALAAVAGGAVVGVFATPPADAGIGDVSA